MAEAGPGAAGGYVAFISYSHKDSATGRWLHRKLEGYRLPKRLAGTQGEDGEVPARLTPIFRDRDELPAAGDLSERVRAALAVSKNLIVLCSPNSAASPWVAKEIATFRELHPGRPIFTAIVEGEPGQCFSPALLEGGVEPLAADLRKEGDGRRLGLLKLVAGLAGVGLDALVQRDAARRVRRVTYVTAAAVTAMLMMALLTAFALNARAEAERQRAEAEGLVEFMLTDLRDRLKGVGRLDVLKSVNDRALHYYQRQNIKSLPPGSLERRARILLALGEDDIKTGSLDKALAQFKEAQRTTAALLAGEPDDPSRLFAHAQSEYWVGRVFELNRQWPAAQRQFESYATAGNRLVAAAPMNPDYMMEAGWGAFNIGNVQLNGAQDPAAAEMSFKTAAQWFRKAGRARPGDPGAAREEANAYAGLADSFYARRQWRGSLQARLSQHRIMARLHAQQPRDAQILYRLALAERAVARSYAQVGDPGAARANAFQAHVRARLLTALDPKNAEWLLVRGFIECDLLYGGFAAGNHAQRMQWREAVTATASLLTRRKYARVSELSSCLRASLDQDSSKI
jgi:hypothetical protein